MQEDWKISDINVESLWLIAERDKSGKHANVYHGNFVPQIPYQLLKRYTNEGDTVMDLFAGSGTTLFEAERLNRNFIGFDINTAMIDYMRSKMNDTKISYIVNECDVCNTEAFQSAMQYSFTQSVDFLIAHPPYMDIVKFTDKVEDLSQVGDLNLFLDKFTQAMRNALVFLKRGKYFAVVIGDVYKNSEVLPLGFYVMNSIKTNFNVKMKGVIVKNIEGNRGKLGAQNIWRYRALKSDYFLFKHEYIFVFKKEF